MTFEDRVALALGRALVRLEAKTIELEQARERIAELEAAPKPRPKKTTLKEPQP